MSYLLDLCARRDPKRAADLDATDAAMLPLYRITINGGDQLTIPCRSAMEAWQAAADIYGHDARIKVERADESGKVVPFPVKATKQELACVELREAQAVAADLAEDVNKGERRFAVTYRRAVEDQVAHLRAVGGL